MGSVMTFSMYAAVFTSPVLPCAIIMAIVNGIKGNQSRMQIYCTINISTLQRSETPKY